MTTNNTWRDRGLGDTSGWVNPAFSAQLAGKAKQTDVTNALSLINDLLGAVYSEPTLNWGLGSISSTNGALTSSTTRIRTQRFAVTKNSVLKFTDTSGLYWYLVGKYYDDGTFVSSGFITNSEYNFTEDVNIVVVLAYKNNSTITDIASLGNLIDVNVSNAVTKKPDGKVAIDGTTYYWEDFTFVGDDIWAFRPSDDATAISTNVGAIYIFDESFNFKKRLLHNFGHCNTIDYNETTDSLIFGNGSGTYGTDGEIYIIKGVKTWSNLAADAMLDMVTGISGSTITKIQVFRTFGDKLNACWGEGNNGLNNICYVLSNDNANVRKLLLGRGVNQFENGQFVSGVAAAQFNGTYKILSEFSMTSIDVNQGTCYYNGYLWCAIGHAGLYVVRMKLNPDGTISTVIKQEKAYKDSGTEYAYASEGIAIKNGIVYHATFNEINAVHKYRAF